jgi:hypothetical protein
VRFRRVPATATWLLERFRSRNDALTGDLIEEYERGRSRIWYWNQVLIAIAVSFCKELRAHPLLTLRALATGWAVWLSYASLKTWLFSHGFFQVLAFRLPLVFGRHGYTQGLVWWMLRLCAWGVSGWLVARLHREHATTMVVAFAASIFFLNLQLVPWTCHLAVVAIDDPRYRLEFLAELMRIFLPPVMALLVGLSGSGAETQPNVRAAIRKLLDLELCPVSPEKSPFRKLAFADSQFVESRCGAVV